MTAVVGEVVVGSTILNPTANVTLPVVTPPPAGVYPDANSTGVPVGAVLVASTSSITTSAAGQIIELKAHTGTITVNHANVIIRKCRFTSGAAITIRNNSTNLLIEDCEFDTPASAGPIVAYNNYTIRRCDMHGMTEGPRISGSNVVIEDSFLHHMRPYASNHADAIQQVSGSSCRISRCNLQPYNPTTGDFNNAGFQFGDDQGSTRGTIVEDCYMNGGNYTVNGGGAGTTTATASFARNKFGHDHRYGIKANLGPGVTWDASNGYADFDPPGQSGIRTI